MFGLKYCEGANSGKRKRELAKIDDEKRRSKNRKNMKQKEQVSCNSWSKDRKWLTYDEENTVILNYMEEEDNWTFLLSFARDC